MIEEKLGDIFSTRAMTIGHGCNCRGRMGAGIAREMKRRYPIVFVEYQRLCEDDAFQPGDVQLVRSAPHWILNMATQNSFGPPIWRGGGVWAKAEWIERCLHNTLILAKEHRITSIAFPRVGCSNGGLYWNMRDFAAKKRVYRLTDVATPRRNELVREVFEKAFKSTSLLVELWTMPDGVSDTRTV